MGTFIAAYCFAAGFLAFGLLDERKTLHYALGAGLIWPIYVIWKCAEDYERKRKGRL